MELSNITFKDTEFDLGNNVKFIHSMYITCQYPQNKPFVPVSTLTLQIGGLVDGNIVYDDYEVDMVEEYPPIDGYITTSIYDGLKEAIGQFADSGDNGCDPSFHIRRHDLFIKLHMGDDSVLAKYIVGGIEDTSNILDKETCARLSKYLADVKLASQSLISSCEDLNNCIENDEFYRSQDSFMEAQLFPTIPQLENDGVKILEYFACLYSTTSEGNAVIGEANSLFVPYYEANIKRAFLDEDDDELEEDVDVEEYWDGEGTCDDIIDTHTDIDELGTLLEEVGGVFVEYSANYVSKNSIHKDIIDRLESF